VVEPLSADAVAQWKRDWTGFMLGYDFFKIDDEKNSDFSRSFEHAARSYARDVNPVRPNLYPRDCWPSADDFRTILHAAGRYEGEAGARLLDRIPDSVLRLLAEIEFAAGIAQLPHSEASRENSCERSAIDGRALALDSNERLSSRVLMERDMELVAMLVILFVSIAVGLLGARAMLWAIFRGMTRGALAHGPAVARADNREHANVPGVGAFAMGVTASKS
jgi:hypothetical protein